MAKKADDTEQSAEQQALEARVDALMDPERPAKPVTTIKNLKSEETDMPKEPVKISVDDAPKPQEEPEAMLPAKEPTVELEDSETEKAVDDIVAKEGDTVLAVEDAKLAKQQGKVKSGGGWKAKFRALIRNKWTWIGAAVVLIALFAIPLTRYKVLGLVIKRSVTITIIDSKTATPVSNAQVELAGNTVKTDAEGRARVSAGVGPRQLVVTKQYYQDLKTNYFVGFGSGDESKVKLTATGRLVPVTVINKITGKPVAGASVKALDTTVKTNAKGKAVIVLPIGDPKRPQAKLAVVERAGTVTLDGYNDTKVTIKVTDEVVPANTFEITPSGQIYFLSNRSGKLDVVKANLDGTDRETVLEGTGREEPTETSLLASRDWRYLVLKSRREGDKDALYLIDTATDKVTQFDNGDANFQLIGWHDHYLVYSLTRNNVAEYLSGHQVIKSYDADRQQLNQLDQNQAENDAAGYSAQYFGNVYLIKNTVVYSVQWNGHNKYYGTRDLTGKNDTIRAVQPNGQNKKDYQTWLATSTGGIQAKLYEPNEVYFSVYNQEISKQEFYEFEDNAVKKADVDQSTFNKAYPTFLLSPSSSRTFWTDYIDGKNVFYTGNDNAEDKKQFASFSDYSPYGWYTDNYVLLTKESSELYVMSSGGQAAGRQPLKITDYYKPAYTYIGYGGGYGGL